MQLVWPQRLALGVCPDAGIHQFAVKPCSLLCRLQENGVLSRAGCAEIIGLAADRNDEDVI